MNFKSLPLKSNNCYSRQEPTRLGPLTGLHSRGRLLALPKNIRQGWKELTVTNTLACYKYGIKYGHKKCAAYLPQKYICKHIKIKIAESDINNKYKLYKLNGLYTWVVQQAYPFYLLNLGWQQYICLWCMDCLHWHCLLVKLSATVTLDCTGLGHLVRCNTDRVVSIYVALLKVAKASTVVSVVCRCRRHNRRCYRSKLCQCKHGLINSLSYGAGYNNIYVFR